MAQISNYSRSKVTVFAPDPKNLKEFIEIGEFETLQLPDSHTVKCKWCKTNYVPHSDIAICPTCGGPYG